MSKVEAETNECIESTEEDHTHGIIFPDDEIRTDDLNIVKFDDDDSCENMSDLVQEKSCDSSPDFHDVEICFEKGLCIQENVTLDCLKVSNLDENQDEVTNESQSNFDTECLETLFSLVDRSERCSGDSESLQVPVYGESCQVLEIPTILDDSFKEPYTEVKAECIISDLEETSLETCDNESENVKHFVPDNNEICNGFYVTPLEEPVCVSKNMNQDNESNECFIIPSNRPEYTLNKVGEDTEQLRPSDKDVLTIDANSCTTLKFVDEKRTPECIQKAHAPIARENMSLSTMYVSDLEEEEEEEEDALEWVQMVHKTADHVRQGRNVTDEQTCTKEDFVYEPIETDTMTVTQHGRFYEKKEKTHNKRVKHKKPCDIDSFNTVCVDDVKYLDRSNTQEVNVTKTSENTIDTTLITHDASACFNHSRSMEKMTRGTRCLDDFHRCYCVEEIPASSPAENRSMPPFVKTKNLSNYGYDTELVKQNCFGTPPEKNTSKLLPAFVPEPFVEAYDRPYAFQSPIPQAIQPERRRMGKHGLRAAVGFQNSPRTPSQSSVISSQRSFCDIQHSPRMPYQSSVISSQTSSNDIQPSPRMANQSSVTYSQRGSCKSVYEMMQLEARKKDSLQKFCNTSGREAAVHMVRKESASLPTKSSQSYYQPPSYIPRGTPSPRRGDTREMSLQQEDAVFGSQRGMAMRDNTPFTQNAKMTAWEPCYRSSSETEEMSCRPWLQENMYLEQVAILQQGTKITVKSLHSQEYRASVPKSLTAKEAILRIKESFGLHSSCGLDLFYDNRLLPESEELKQCCGKDCLYLVQRPRHRTIRQRQYFTNKKDMIDPFENEEPRLLMSCGHPITPTNLFRYCWSKIKDGAIDITCPAVPNEKQPSCQCEKLWAFQEYSTKACLSNDEKSLFQILLFHNWVQREGNVKKCPKCGIYIQSTCERKGYFTCRICGNQRYCKRCYRVWQNNTSKICSSRECVESLRVLQKQLETSGVKTIIGVTGCPKVRACPKCQTLTEHEGDACKHMDCPNQTCRTQFCFICLAVKVDKYYWPDSCQGAFIKCERADIQRVL